MGSGRVPGRFRLLELLEAEHAAMPPGEKLYCPHPGCSCPLLRPSNLWPDEPSECPACHRTFCATCLTTGWHEGFTCAEYGQLSADDRSPDTASLLRLGCSRGWRRCPGCRALVEREAGCNHVRCRCGARFCYACGKEYLSARPTEDNVHGTPGCECTLWHGVVD
ncbi:hypothetical protein GPECTOR_26g471 [Gonium pectorale]|uniref:RBR-type E3 ubiquitin transferase n=1 Tax=Gonium pectorale TaxID=33097 RepID=A0A150GFG8_GONPE|nr:hypothetical protein GPECTOR_26g471 [Gonium pectorale]|eukprot:KXZ48568.1 hypothetical protein GPECTOR_26g471 [Gonium pectorale]